MVVNSGGGMIEVERNRRVHKFYAYHFNKGCS